MAASDKPIIEYDLRPEEQKKLIKRWWTAVDENVHEHIFPVVKEIEARQSYQLVRNLRNARLYSNLEIFGLQAGIFSRTAQQALVNNRVTFNVIKSCVDTSASKIAKMKPRPMFLTIKGSDEMQRNAKKLTYFMDGAFQAGKVYPEMQMSFTDSAVFGTGPTKFVKEGKKVIAKRKLIDEILVDDSEGMYGRPLVLYETEFVNRFTLAAQYPKFREKILSAQVGVTGDFFNSKEFDRVRVIYAWKLPSYVGAKDGRFAICISNATLDHGEYKKNYFPFVFQRWNPKLTGFHGCGLAEELTGIQLEINKLLRTVQISQHLMCVPRIWVENGSMVNTAHINNDIGGIGKYTGTPPTVTTWPGVAPEVYQHIENLVHKAYEITGISMLSAQSKKPAGLDSGVAIRNYQDIESERFQLVSQRYEEAHMTASEIMVDMYKDIKAETGADVEMTVEDGKWVQKIKWSEIELDESQSVMRVFPTSLLPTQPAAKIQKVQEYMQSGLLDRETGLRLLEFPDIDSAMSLRLAAIDNAQEMVSLMLEKGQAITPEPFMNLKVAKQAAQNAYLKGQINKVPEDRLELLRQFIENCDTLVAQASQASMPPQQGASGAEAGTEPMAQPEAPPVSDLIQNVPGGE